MSLRRLLPVLAALLFAAALASTQPLPKPLVVVLIGPPASGKSTQAEYLNKKYKLPVIAIEELVAARMGPTAAGQDLHRGDPAINSWLRKHLESIDVSRGFVLDGYPSTRAQMEYLGGLVKELGLPSPIVIQIHIRDNEAQERAKARGGRDDTPEIISQRLQRYHAEMDLLRSYYPEADIWTIDGTREPQGVSSTIRLLIEDRME